MELIKLEVKRKPLIPLEEGISGYYFLSLAIKQLRAIDSRKSWELENTILNPSAIFGGLVRENYHNAVCYAARPGQWLDSDGQLQSARTGFVQLVYAARYEDLKQLVVFAVAAGREDNRFNGYPDNWITDLGDPIWKRELPFKKQ